MTHEEPHVQPRPVVFGPADRALAGFLHVPQRPVRSLGVVLCNPLGYEAMCTHRSYRALAERLAARGFASLRFDYDGTGNSSGLFRDAGRVQAWLDSASLAIDELLRQAGVRRVALFGVRFGAALATEVASRRHDVDSLVLWAPPASGRAYVREMRAFRMIQAAKTAPALIGGVEEVAGYPFDPETLAAMSSLELPPATNRLAERALVLTRDDLAGAEARVAERLRATGATVQILEEPGYAAMMRDPQETVVPSKALDAVVAWLETGPAPSGRAVVPTIEPQSPIVAASFRESPIFFPAGDGASLFGVLTTPASGARPADRPAVLFLNVGANHHVGPNGMYVRLARELAARGYVSLRFDVAGLGDSPDPPGARKVRLYSKDSVADVKAAMSFVEATEGTRRFMLAGLCSGAYLAFHTAVEDPRVVGQILLNPQTFEWKEGDSLELSVRKSFLSTRYYLRALLDGRVWTRAVRGQVNVRGVLGALGKRFVDRAKASATELRARAKGDSAPRTDIERAFVALSDRGVESFLVFSFSDGGLDMIERHLGSEARRMRGRSNFELAVVEGADHTFTPLGSQEALYGLIHAFVAKRFG